MRDLFSCFCTTFLFPLSPPRKEKKKRLSLWCSEINDVLLIAGVDLHHDVQNALSEDTGHCDSSQLWRGKLPFYTLAQQKVWLYATDLLFSCNTCDTFRSRASCCTSGRACRPTCSLSSAPPRWWTSWASVTPSSTRPSLGCWCPPSCKHCLTGERLF